MPHDVPTMSSETRNGAVERQFPPQKPEGFVPAVQRYSARLPHEVREIQVLYLGMQSRTEESRSVVAFLHEVSKLLSGPTGPVHFDFATYDDMAGYPTVFAAAYWERPSMYEEWAASRAVRDWWLDPEKTTGPKGFFWEAMVAAVDHFETITFKEYVRGLAACPMCRIEPMGESGYWGAARDRIPASANDRFEVPDIEMKVTEPAQDSIGRRLAIAPHKNFVAIRSGVSWEACGEEQLNSFENNLKPKLDAGMEFLRNNPQETGCYALRQSRVLSPDGTLTKEEYSLGFFRCLEDLETWSREHPTHLAIYTRAMAERKKYQDQLELRTYQEIYVLARTGNRFEYVNCHQKTGLLPFFAGKPAG